MLAPMRPSPIIASCMTFFPVCGCDAFVLVENRASRGLSRCNLEHAAPADEIVRRAVVPEPGLGLALKLGDDPLRQDLAELDAPLIERIDVPDRALGEHAVLIERDQLAQCRRGQAF